MGVSAFCTGAEPVTEQDYLARVRVSGARPPWSDVQAVAFGLRRERTWVAIQSAARARRAEIDPNADVNALKGALALNANDDTRPAERDEARRLLDSYAASRGESGWAETAAKIIAARNAWANRIIGIAMLEDASWRALEQATTADQVAEIERQITEAIRGV
ncbi:MAG: hypothetical protein AB1781_10990 [Pseudomonadota bacterium]